MKTTGHQIITTRADLVKPAAHLPGASIRLYHLKGERERFLTAETVVFVDDDGKRTALKDRHGRLSEPAT